MSLSVRYVPIFDTFFEEEDNEKKFFVEFFEIFPLLTEKVPNDVSVGLRLSSSVC